MTRCAPVGRRSGVAVSAVAVGLLAACGGAPDAAEAGDLPTTLHGLPLAMVHTGEEAAEMIATLHRTGVAPEDSRVAVYQVEGLRAVLYESRFPSDADAARQLRTMSDSIGDGSFGFGHHTVAEIAGTEVHTVVGHGQMHAFFTRGAEVIWLSAPPMMERMMLAEVLGVDPSEVPQTAEGSLPPATPEE